MCWRSTGRSSRPSWSGWRPGSTCGRGFDAIQGWVLALREELGIPHTLEALGIGNNRFDELSEMAAKDPTAGGNARPFDAEAARQLFDHAWNGTGI